MTSKMSLNLAQCKEAQAGLQEAEAKLEAEQEAMVQPAAEVPGIGDGEIGKTEEAMLGKEANNGKRPKRSETATESPSEVELSQEMERVVHLARQTAHMGTRWEEVLATARKMAVPGCQEGTSPKWVTHTGSAAAAGSRHTPVTPRWRWANGRCRTRRGCRTSGTQTRNLATICNGWQLFRGPNGQWRMGPRCGT